jgi:hypothetical protein
METKPPARSPRDSATRRTRVVLPQAGNPVRRRFFSTGEHLEDGAGSDDRMPLPGGERPGNPARSRGVV